MLFCLQRKMKFLNERANVAISVVLAEFANLNKHLFVQYFDLSSIE